MAAKVKQLVEKHVNKGRYDDKALLVPVGYSNNCEGSGEDYTEVEKGGRKYRSSCVLPHASINVIEPEVTTERYEQITRNLSKEMRSFVPSPEMMRRNAICDEIEKRTVADTKGTSLRKRRVEMLKVDVMKEMSLI